MARRGTVPAGPLRRVLVALAVLALSTVSVLAAPGGAATATVVARGPAWATTWPSESTTSLVVQAPATAQAGDVLVAMLGVGRTTAGTQPTLTAPAGWTLVTRTNQGSVGTLAVYTHVYATGERSYTFLTNVTVGGVGFVSAFGGVDGARPVDVAAGRTVGKGTSVATPSLTTTSPGDLLVAGYYAYRGGGTTAAWTPPSGMAELADSVNASRSGSVAAVTQASAGSTGAKTASVTPRVDYAIAALVALRPGTSTSTGQAPVLSALAASAVTDTAATVTWRTDQLSDSQVDYGTTTAYGTTTPRDATLVTDHRVTLTGLRAGTTYHVRARSANSAGQSTTSADLSFTTAPTPPAAGRTPVIVDTDMFSSADDVGALAVAFGLQLRGEADVVGIAVDTRTSRPAVATNSWRCAAAIAQFYGDPNVPLGTSMPNSGTQTASIDFIRPCAQRASSSTPVPSDAVQMYRRVLAAQPDASVVIASVGYLDNLRDLLDSPADTISPLSGTDLVARKVRSLVVMGGGYPSSSGENNLVGDPAASQRVASGWPTRVEWSGEEVGDVVHTGDSISLVHPADSPVRIAYEAYVGPRKWIESYDLTAVYRALRPADGVFGLVGPGRNVVNGSGGNSFTTGSGNQYYLTVPDPTAAARSIEALLDVLPGTTSSGPSDDFASGMLDPTRWSVGGSGSTVAAANGQLEITHPGGGWTTGSVASTSPHDQTGRSVQLRLRRAANGGLGGSTFGETSVRLQVDASHYAEFWIASGSIVAMVDSGTGAVNLNPNWPAYSSTAMQWLRFRESGGRLYLEYAAGSTSPTSWQALASLANPFSLRSVRLSVIAGANTATSDVAKIDDVSTY